MKFKITYADGVVRTYTEDHARSLPVLRNGALIEHPTAPRIHDVVVDSAAFETTEHTAMNEQGQVNLLHHTAIWPLISITKVERIKGDL